MNCPNCGTPAKPGDRFCQACGITLDSLGAPGISGGAATVTSETYGTPTSITAGTLPGTPILLGDGEVIWRQYRAAQLRTREHGEGTLFVTDSRVVFFARAKGRGTQRPSALVQQTKLEHVTGLAAYVSRRFSLGLFLFTVALALITLWALSNKIWIYVIIFGTITAVCVALLLGGAAKRGSVGVIIHSSATQASPISFGQFGEQRSALGSVIHLLLSPMLALFGVYTAFDVLVGFPGQDSDKVIAELGALIFDLQTQGNLAGSHWGVEAAQIQRGVSE